MLHNLEEMITLQG